jgi:hypothetical protein
MAGLAKIVHRHKCVMGQITRWPIALQGGGGIPSKPPLLEGLPIACELMCKLRSGRLKLDVVRFISKIMGPP